ncbi:MAG TPA: non-canonical purine NTP pyrophosphatase [Chloroflexota bacterium]|nr:non-canonical purine NTP pyrophosphatase [Chloroflexota bacterium]
MRKILLATNNEGKVEALRALLEGLPVEVVSPAELGIELDVPEVGATYAENAREKALAFAAATGLPSIADDSGLEIRALGGWPGLHSVRFAGPGVDLAQRQAIILERMRGLVDRAARFVCVVALAEPGRVIAEADGVLEGTILEAERGSGGFGYDRVFLPNGMTRTLAEISEAEKASFTHRARAIQALLPRLVTSLGLDLTR